MKDDIRIKVPGKAQAIIDRITEAGYEAYVVGGCVRDSCLGRDPKDWDITTSARPQEVKALFAKTIDTGLKHGTVTVMMGGEGFEVTTYRVDGVYEDARHPKEVRFTPRLEEDLRRRDFSINAMAYNEAVGLVDCFGGLQDMKAGVLRCVGEPAERFGEDALRILRAVRFSAQLGFSIEEETCRAIRRLAPTLGKISAERIQAELFKLFVSPNPDFLRVAYETGITKVVFPEFDAAMETPQVHPHHCYCVGEHILHSMLYVDADRVLRLAMLFHDIGKPSVMTLDGDGTTHFHGHAAVSARLAEDVLRRWKTDNDTINRVCRLVLYHDYGNSLEPDMRFARRALYKIGEEAFPGLFAVKRADILAQSRHQRQEKLAKLDKWRRMYEEIQSSRQCVSLKTLAVTGQDLIAAGWKPGRQLGETLHKLLELVLEEPDCNTKERLLEEAKKL